MRWIFRGTQSKRKIEEPAPIAAPNEPGWVTEMRDYYKQNGFYRQADLGRLLGDPRESVRLTPDEKVQCAAGPEK